MGWKWTPSGTQLPRWDVAEIKRMPAVCCDLCVCLVIQEILLAARNHKWLNNAEVEQVQLKLGNAFEIGSFSEASHIYMLSTCFGRDLFEQFLTAASVSTQLQWVVTSQPIPFDLLAQHNTRSDGKQRQLNLYSKLQVTTTWTHNCILTIYRRES